MRRPSRLRWQQADRTRHALDSPHVLGPGERFRALCGAVVTTGADDFPSLGTRWLAPACLECNGVWLRMESMPSGLDAR
ncbi:MAG: zinc finger protein [Haloechinothrix sp.]